MASAYVSPGLYIRERDESLFVSNLADTPLGAVGLAKWGPVNEATLVTSQAQLFSTFGPLSGASSYSPAASVANYPDHPMVYAVDRYLRRGRRAIVVRVGDTTAGNATALAKATGYLMGATTNRTPPTVNSTVPAISDPATQLTAIKKTTGGSLSDGNYIVVYTLVNANGETKASPASTTVALSGVSNAGGITITPPAAVTGATAYNLYVVFSAGTPDASLAQFISQRTDFGGATFDYLGPLPSNTASKVYKVTAKYHGTHGNSVQLHVARGSDWSLSSPSQKVTVFLKSPVSNKTSQVEVFDGLVADAADTTDDVIARINNQTSGFVSLDLISPPATNTSGLGSPPGALVSAVAGSAGSLATGSYRVGVSYEDATGETVATYNGAAVSVTGPNGSIAVTTETTVPAGALYVHVYISPAGGANTDARRVQTRSKPTGGWGTSSQVFTVTQTADKQWLELSPSTAPNVTLTGGQDGLWASNATLATKQAIFVGTPETLSSDPTGLQIFRNSEANRVSLLAVPGISYAAVVNEMIDVCAVGRGDCLALVDPPANLKPQEVMKWHNGQLGTTGAPTVALNSSYAALYWPWLKTLDALNEQELWLPPSGFIAEVIAFNDYQADPWFAPAGLVRGRINNVLQAQYKPNQGDRDVLYSGGNAVNPITTFAANGIVVWGQRTLQREPTALDRVNVRRLLIVLRLAIDAAARVLVFQPNDNTLWRRFSNTVNPILEGVRQRRGLVDFKVVMDASTNTPDVIEQNQCVGNVFLKPTKAAEMIILNFIVTTQSSTFDENINTGSI
jgi:phage tail sheath protein FI